MTDNKPVTLPPSIAHGVHRMLAQREKGIAKYGMPVEEAKGIGVGGWIAHLGEELADANVYFAMLDAKLGILNVGLKQLSELIDATNTQAVDLCRDLQVLLAGKVADPAQPQLIAEPVEEPKRKPRSRRNG